MREIFVAAVALGVIGVFIWLLAGIVQSLVSRRSQPVRTVYAEIADKSHEVGTGEFGKDGVRLGKSVYTVSFSADEEWGKGLCLNVSESEYNALEAGDTGYLTYRGSTFLHFEKNKNSPAAE